MNTIYKAESIDTLSCAQAVHVSLGAYGRLTHQQAIELALNATPREPLLGRLSTQRLQLCPQNRGKMDVDVAMQLRADYPDIEFRLHANVHIEQQARIVDIADWPNEKEWFRQMAQVSSALAAPAYTAHAGKRAKATVSDVLHDVLEIEQLFGVPVGIEGHYPSPDGKDHWLISTWQEYRLLLESGVHYALDLSHLNIVAMQSRYIEWHLVHELLASPKCLEIHVSDNYGVADQHLPLQYEHLPWWWPLLPDANPQAVIFSEGRQRVPSIMMT